MSSSNLRSMFTKRLKEAAWLWASPRASWAGGLVSRRKSCPAGLDGTNWEIREPDLTKASKFAKELCVPVPYLLADNDVLADIILAAAGMSAAEQRRMAAELKTNKKGAAK